MTAQSPSKTTKASAKPTLMVGEASERLLARSYPSLDEMIVCRVMFAIGKLLQEARGKIISGDETVKTALRGGIRLNQQQERGEIFTAAEVHVISSQLKPGGLRDKEDGNRVKTRIDELVPPGMELRDELDGLGLEIVTYQKSVHDREGDYCIGICKKK